MRTFLGPDGHWRELVVYIFFEGGGTSPAFANTEVAHHLTWDSQELVKK